MLKREQEIKKSVQVRLFPLFNDIRPGKHISCDLRPRHIESIKQAMIVHKIRVKCLITSFFLKTSNYSHLGGLLGIEYLNYFCSTCSVVDSKLTCVRYRNSKIQIQRESAIYGHVKYNNELKTATSTHPHKYLIDLNKIIEIIKF